MDLRSMLERVESKYNVRLPRRVIMVDYGEDIGDLYIRFKQSDRTDGEPTLDGRVLVHYDPKGKIQAIEIMDITTL
jgi:uncharacterized protein YuzE